MPEVLSMQLAQARRARRPSRQGGGPKAQGRQQGAAPPPPQAPGAPTQAKPPGTRESGRGSSLWFLILRAATFDRSVYAEIRDRPEATFSALAIAISVAIALALGLRNTDTLELGGSPVLTAAWRVNFIVIAWLLWAWESVIIGRYGLGGNASVQQLLRSLGFAMSPGIFFVLASIPTAGEYIFYVVIVWILATGVLAVKETLQVSWWKGVPTAVFGWFVAYLVLLNLMNVLSVSNTEA